MNAVEFVGDSTFDRLGSLVERTAELADNFTHEEEDLHQLRVNSRKIRALLVAYYGESNEKRVAKIISELKWLNGYLGPARNADVLTTRLRETSHSLKLSPELTDRFQNENRWTREALLLATSQERFLSLIALMHQWNEFRIEKKLTDFDWKNHKRAHRNSWRKFKSKASKTKTDLHYVRILAKKARYIAEFSSETLGEKVATRASFLESIQNVLGEHQDSVVLYQWLCEQPTNDQVELCMSHELEQQERLRAKYRKMVSEYFK